MDTVNLTGAESAGAIPVGSTYSARLGAFRAVGNFVWQSLIVIGAAVALVVFGLGWAIAWAYKRVGQTKRTLIATTGFSLGSLWALHHYADTLGADLSLFGSMMLSAISLVNIFYVVMRYGHSKFDPVAQVKAGNVAFVLYAAIIGALLCFGASLFAP